MKAAEKKALKDMEKAVLEGDAQALEQALAVVDEPAAVLTALAKGLDAAREKLGTPGSSVAEFLLCVDAMRLGLDRIKRSAPMQGRKKVIIGVMQGDVHDMGKNIVAGVMEACGCEVTDLGRDVSPERFVEAAAQAGAEVLALSTMMSTPLADMAKTIALCRSRLPQVKILVGGAPLDAQAAWDLGADGYSESAVGVPEELERIIRGKGAKTKTSRVFVDYEKKLRVEETG